MKFFSVQRFREPLQMRQAEKNFGPDADVSAQARAGGDAEDV
ncbi:MAG: hypothetical protein Q8L49_04530 [Burkholderiaceae bacterium]|nr:hypothetical protein [Burkholderiaceae bacterium]